MKKFLVIYHAPVEATAQMSQATPEEQQKGMEAWMQWAQQCGSKLTDLGAPLMGGKEIASDGSVKESSRQVAGYSVLQADSMDEARALLTGHPHLSGWHPQATIEIHEFVPMPGM